MFEKKLYNKLKINLHSDLVAWTEIKSSKTIVKVMQLLNMWLFENIGL